jgi:uncharacterized sporulation protein YeaH/YhbH (DUF444 family)
MPRRRHSLDFRRTRRELRRHYSHMEFRFLYHSASARVLALSKHDYFVKRKTIPAFVSSATDFVLAVFSLPGLLFARSR